MIFNQTDYVDEKMKMVRLIAQGRFEGVVGAVNRITFLAPEWAENDSDIDWIRICVKTKNFTRHMPVGKAKKLLARVRGKTAVGESDFSKKCAGRAVEYLDACIAASKKKRRVKICACIACAVIGCASCAAFFCLDGTGMLYGIGELTFSADGRTYSQRVLRFNDYAVLKLPSKSGYDISGVRDNNTGELLFNENGVSAEKVKERDLSDYYGRDLEVVYTPHEYTASVNNTASGVVTSFTYTVEDNPEIIINDPQALEGYVFDGWYVDSGYNNKFSGHFKDYIDKPLVLYPHYSLEEWTIEWNLNGGERLAELPLSYNILTDISLPDGAVIVRRGYELVGWSYNGSIIDHFSSSAMKNITLSAVWQPRVYTVDYKLNGGQMGVTERQFTVEESVLLPSPERAGYEFAGWYSSDTFTDRITEIPRGTAENITLYALWQPIVYHIEYDLDGGTNNLLNPDIYTIERNVRLLEPEKKGYSFVGWYDSLSGQFKEDLCASTDGDIKLFAVWEAKNYTVTICPDNGGSQIIQKVTYDSYYSLSMPYCKGYTLQGYSCCGEPFNCSGVYAYDYDIVVIAHYEANVYQISYVSDGETIKTQSVVYGQPYNLYIPDGRDNYEFIGWRDSAYGGQTVSDGIYNCDHNLAVYASWRKTLTVDLQSGNDYTIDETIEKVYITGNYSRALNNVMSDICITVSERNSRLTMVLVNVGFAAKDGRAAIDCKNSSYTLNVLVCGDNFIEGGKGKDGENGVDGARMTSSDCHGQDGGNGGVALNCGKVVFEEMKSNSSLTLKGGNGGDGGNGGVDTDRSRMWLNYVPNGGDGGDSANAITCISYSVNGTAIDFVKGRAGNAGKAGSRGDWWCAACYGSAGKHGEEKDAIGYK